PRRGPRSVCNGDPIMEVFGVGVRSQRQIQPTSNAQRHRPVFTPKALYNPAQGKRSATLGRRSATPLIFTPKALHSGRCYVCAAPSAEGCTVVARFLPGWRRATLGRVV